MKQTISEAELEVLVTKISVIQGKLRAVYLRAHPAQRVVLTQDQVRQYAARLLLFPSRGTLGMVGTVVVRH